MLVCNSASRASGGTGRRTGLKILGVMSPWEFESPLAHQGIIRADVAELVDAQP